MGGVSRFAFFLIAFYLIWLIPLDLLTGPLARQNQYQTTKHGWQPYVVDTCKYEQINTSLFSVIERDEWISYKICLITILFQGLSIDMFDLLFFKDRGRSSLNIAKFEKFRRPPNPAKNITAPPKTL